MPVGIDFISAFLVGLMGGVHCIGMCGGIVAALSLGAAPAVNVSADMDAQRPGRAPLSFLLAYNGGRILSYSVAGVLVGGLGGVLLELTQMHHARLLLQLLAGGFMLALGLYLSGWWTGLLRIERLGLYVWKYLEPVGRRLLPVSGVTHAFLLGLVWGWLPCGLVYSVLIWSLASGSALQGGLLMLGFGLGTLPLLITLGIWSARLSTLLRQQWLRALAGLLVMGYGVLMLVQSIIGLSPA